MASPVESLRRIAAAHGEAAPPLPAVDDRDLTAAAGLVALDAAWLAPALAAPPALAGLGTALATFAGQADAAAATFAGADEALGAAVRAAAAARPGRRRGLLGGGAAA
ncbi:MAG: hypothetical protein ACK539_00595, partial [Planctomycetota bacterium]